MNYRAVFFDRDQTLTRKNEQTGIWLRKQIQEWSGHPYEMDYDRMMYLFELAEYPDQGMKDVKEEILFWHRYFECVLRDEGITEQVEEKAEMIFAHEWLRERRLYPEVIRVLTTLKEHGLLLGVISDTTPALSLTLKSLGIADYFDSFICSDKVGVMKPEAEIYEAALNSLSLTAEECIYVDDSQLFAEAARELGFTAFHLNRTENHKEDTAAADEWEISSLTAILDYLDLTSESEEILKNE